MSQLLLLYPSEPLSLQAAYTSDASGTVTALLSWATPSETGTGDATFNLTSYSFTATPSASQNANAVLKTPLLPNPRKAIIVELFILFKSRFFFFIVDLCKEKQESVSGLLHRDALCFPERERGTIVKPVSS